MTAPLMPPAVAAAAAAAPAAAAPSLAAGQAPAWPGVLTATLAAALVAVALGLLFLMLLGHPLDALLEAFVVRPLATARARSDLMVKATPLILIGLGLAMGFRAGVWNIGAEGQYLLGALAAAVPALSLGPGGGAWVLPLCLGCGIAGGVAWAAIPAALRTATGASEILTSLMLVYAAEQLLAWAVIGPLRSPSGFSFPETELFAAAASLPRFQLPAPGGALTLWLSVPLALLLMVGLALFVHVSRTGFLLRLSGLSPAAARFAGARPGRLVWVAMVTSGALAGLAGAAQALGPVGQLTQSFGTGAGFTAIIVAFLARLHLVAVVPAALFLSLLSIGAERAQIGLGLPVAVGDVFQGLVLLAVLAVGGRGWPRLRLWWRAPRHGPPHGPRGGADRRQAGAHG